MAYKNNEDQKKAARQHYEDNRELIKERTRQRRRDNRDLIKAIKENTPCVDCGIIYPYYVMDFDHLGKEAKVGNIATMTITHGKNAILAEIAKCELVCSNCHRIRTHNRLKN
jgi:hypothetical protein